MKHHMTITVRFSDTDMLGHVNNASYFTYMEEARLYFMNAIEITGAALIIASAKVDWRAQTYFPDTLDVETYITRIGNSSFDVATTLTSQRSSQVVFEGIATLVHFDYETQKSIPLSDSQRKCLEGYLEAR
ncbi:acyl-CoA thioesterase [Alicyclobacillus mengziensis]|uniref:Acyl-CoA thioesterase n=1 Tax=Alicyclobacillus mengziensis TaxID=2931921 RepID=A0A9X7Z977_9BACL|nr:thioesterase family protein [Alicyclobacillus mengziensis]QSO49141.1 acyl-CoA thioesterase [Alicyclobacillus mengziensis]